MTPKECERIYNEAYRAVYWTAMSLMKNETDAEDVTQETFVAMLESYDTLQDKTKVVPWLKKICAYKCLNLLSRTKTTAVEQEFLENAETVPENFLPESIVESAEKRKIIMDIIEKALSEDVRSTIILFYFDEMSTQEIAGALGIPLGTVLWRLNFARKKIKQEVERYEKETDTKLHSLALPFLALLFMKEADMVTLPPMPASLAELSVSKEAALARASKNVVAETIRKGTGIAMKKIIIACVCAATIGIAVAGGIFLNNRDEEEPARQRRDKTEQSAGVIRERGNKSDDVSENKNDETENDQKDDNKNENENDSKNENENDNNNNNNDPLKQEDENNPGNQQSAFPKELSSEIQRGSYVLFGSYEQDNNELNGPEDIEWIVLDCEGDRLLLISRYVLDAVPFNRDYANVTWETCTLRSWLNEEFINVAFSTEERAMIPQVQIKNFALEGNARDTDDRVFCLSLDELVKYYGLAYDRYSYFGYCKELITEPTEYAKARDVWTYTVDPADDYFFEYATERYVASVAGLTGASWWLRSTGWESTACMVTPYGYAGADYDFQVSSEGYGVRPVLWVEKDAVSETQDVVKKTITFGKYADEDIEWIILDESDDGLLLLSKKIIEGSIFSRKMRNVTWEISSLRTWLNDEFYFGAFDAEERQYILNTAVTTPPNPDKGTTGGNDTQDYVFLLSLDEVYRYFPMKYERTAEATEYASPKVHLDPDTYGNNASWWLRTMQDYDNSSVTSTVYLDGRIVGTGVSTKNLAGVRPAMWISKDAVRK